MTTGNVQVIKYINFTFNFISNALQIRLDLISSFPYTKFSIKAVTIIFLVSWGTGGEIKLIFSPVYKNATSHKGQTLSTNSKTK